MTDALVPVVETPAVGRGRGGDLRRGVGGLGRARVAAGDRRGGGPAAVGKFVEFLARRIANERTWAAYARAAGQFLGWCEARALRLEAVSPLHVAAYIRTHPGSAPTVKQHLAAIRMLCDWVVVSQVLPVNPAAAVRGPKHVVTKGATPILSPAEARKLLETIDTGALAGLRDRALLSVMLYSFASAGPGDAEAGLLRAGEPGVAAAPREGGGSGTTSRPIIGRPRPSTPTSRRRSSRSRRRRSSRASTRRGAG